MTSPTNTCYIAVTIRRRHRGRYHGYFCGRELIQRAYGVVWHNILILDQSDTCLAVKPRAIHVRFERTRDSLGYSRFEGGKINELKWRTFCRPRDSRFPQRILRTVETTSVCEGHSFFFPLDKTWCAISILPVLTGERSMNILTSEPAQFQGTRWWVTSNGKFRDEGERKKNVIPSASSAVNGICTSCIIRSVILSRSRLEADYVIPRIPPGRRKCNICADVILNCHKCQRIAPVTRVLYKRPFLQDGYSVLDRQRIV